MTNDLNELVMRISGWGLERNITEDGGVTAQDQVSKLIEELAECVSTLGKISKAHEELSDAYDEMEFTSDKEATELYMYLMDEKLPELEEKLKDDYGDMIVCIIQAMRLSETDMVECLNKSWEDIKDRKGQMINGKFVKEDDL